MVELLEGEMQKPVVSWGWHSMAGDLESGLCLRDLCAVRMRDELEREVVDEEKMTA